MGDVTPDERTEVEAMAQKHPAVKAELEAIERATGLYAEAYAVEPAENLRNRVLNSLTAAADDEPEVIPITHASSNTFFKYAFAACFALMIVSTIALISVYQKLEESNNLVASLQSQNRRFANQTSLMDNELRIFRDSSFKTLELKGTAKSPSSALMLAWNPANKRVMIDMNHADMPVNDKNHQYQLWALVAGKPVDLGVFDADTASKGMKEMKPVALADAFAVTLEQRGGSPVPTMDQMVVIGKF